MRTATYTGPLTHLKGKTALVRDTEAGVLAQFNETRLLRSGRAWPTVLVYEPHARFPTEQPIDESNSSSPPSDALGFGWHLFAVEDFSAPDSAKAA